MDKKQEFFLEAELYKEVCLFLEVCEEGEKEKRVKKAILDFNKKRGTSIDDVLKKLNKMLDEKLSKQLNKMKLKEDEEELEL